MPSWQRIAHRGASAHAPENTLASFKRALEIGTDAIEMDVRLTKDRQMVICHDATLDRTTNMRGSVAEMTFDEVREADAGAWFNDRFRNERVPSLQEALECIPTGVAILLEVKVPRAASHALKIVKEMGRIDQVEVISFEEEALKITRERNKQIRTTLIFDKTIVKGNPMGNAVAMLEQAKAVGTSRVTVQLRLASPPTVMEVHRLGGEICSWTANDPAEIEAMIQAGVNGITSNYPDRLNEALACTRTT